MDGSQLYLVVAVLCAFALAWVLLPSGKMRKPVLQNRLSLERLPFVRNLLAAQHKSYVRRCCLNQIPELLDISTLGLSAGLSFDVSLGLYCAEYHNELSQEIARTMLAWRVGMFSRAQALEKLAEDLDLAALRRFSAAVVEAINFGSPLAAVLERQAQSVRDEQRAQVEEEIERAPVKMLIPLGTLIVPAMMLAILGPLLASTSTIAGP